MPGGWLLDAAAGLAALAAMYLVPYTVLGDARDWSLYIYWVAVAAAYSAYALARLAARTTEEAPAQ